MTDSGQGSDPKFEIEDDLDYLFANASPNPTREGCPPRDVLIALSRREKPIGDPDYLHLVRCSPCFRDFRAIQQANKAKTRANRLWAVSAAAVFVLAVAGIWIMRSDRSTASVSGRLSSTAVSADQLATLDLRPYSVTRGDDRRVEGGALIMPPGRVNATLLLPVGSEPGAYDVRILDQDLRVRASAQGSAAIRNYITTLQAVMDLSTVGAGDYQLALKRESGEWQMFPLRVR